MQSVGCNPEHTVSWERENFMLQVHFLWPTIMSKKLPYNTAVPSHQDRDLRIKTKYRRVRTAL